jgi:hypothetical protein
MSTHNLCTRAGRCAAILIATLMGCSSEGDGGMSAAGAGATGGIGGMSPFAGAGAGMAPTGGGGGAAGAAGVGTGGMGATGGMMATGGVTATGGMMATGGTAGIDPGADPGYHDPGTGPWEMATPEECKIDVGMIGGGDNLAVFRYGKLCHVQGGNTSGANWSVTKTLGGVLAGRAAYLVKDVPRSGAGTGPILHEDKLADWVSPGSLNGDALLSHVMSMTAYNSNLAYGSKSFAYDTVGTREISRIVDVSMVAVAQVDGLPTSETEFMTQEVFGKLGITDSSWPGGTIGYGWAGTLEDMGRVGVMLAHDGWYGGERFMEASWVYRMSHASHEDANAAYGQLAWLNSRGGGNSFGSQIDDCAPAAFWPSYPHVGSEAPDCMAADGNCEQEHDVGVFSAQGLGGQFIVVHPGLDLVITAHNSGNPPALWAAVRPGLVAMDPMFTGDETAFCAAYGSGSYAPDLRAPRIAPTM